MPQGNPQPGELYLHFKNRKYQVLAVARHSETGEKLVIYQALYGTYRVYARPYDMFVSEVDHSKYPQVEQVYRFQYLTEEDLEAEDPAGKEPAAAEVSGTAGSGEAPQASAGTEAWNKAVTGGSCRSEVPQAGAGVPGQEPDRDSGSAVTEEAEDPGDDAQAEEDPGDNTQEEAADPWLIRFMDAENMEEKMQVFSEMRPHITDRLIDEIAMVSDLSIPEGELYERYRQLKECLDMRMRFEGSRIRG